MTGGGTSLEFSSRKLVKMYRKCQVDWSKTTVAVEFTSSKYSTSSHPRPDIPSKVRPRRAAIRSAETWPFGPTRSARMASSSRSKSSKCASLIDFPSCFWVQMRVADGHQLVKNASTTASSSSHRAGYGVREGGRTSGSSRYFLFII